MEAIVLAGGFGTRLRHIVSDVPKPMADVCGKPFLEYILKQLANNGVTRVVLAVGYKKEVIMDYFGEKYFDMDILYSSEEEPLFTGGAIKQAMGLCNESPVFVVNGDTYFDVDLKEMYNTFERQRLNVMVAIKRMVNFDRYGTVEVEAGRINAFNEKKACDCGYINGGIYLLNKNVLKDYKGAFSFEKAFLEEKVGAANIMAFASDGYFIDIGIPDDYYKANEDFKEFSL